MVTAPHELASEEQQKRALVQRVADSAGFRNATRLRDFLLFVTDLALSGRAQEISEQHIGHAVFHRAVAYDTTNDNIVRVSARQLRVKLKEYAERDGTSDIWSLDIPKGGYVPVFIPRDATGTASSAPPGAMLPDPALWRWKVAACLFAVLAVGGFTGWWRARSASGGRDTGQSPLTDLIVRPGQRTLVVLADSSMVLLHELTGQLPTADDYAARLAPPAPKDPSMQVVTRSIASQQLTSIADVGFAMRLLRVRPDAADRIHIVHARNLGPRALKEGNAILLGGPRSNPWARLFEERLNYHFDFSGERASARIVNKRPRPGELALYETERRKDTVYKSFARIALVPNLDNSGRVLLISGATIEATEAATEFFMGQHSATPLREALGRATSDGAGFEILLETIAIDGTARNSRIAGARVLP
jgi:hypothetical protein